AILAADAKPIAKAPGVGAKTAERVILDLKDKISIEDTISPKETVSALSVAGEDIGNKKNEAVEALVALGYSASDALRAVKQVEMTEDIGVEEILKAALKYIF
ncbi:MAG: Holliday junction branch migration protein RuvA, partial [Lachnospiraceae bacterium]|nr:Holliday junction branch migration protein RuvA [Lachnospiraceae bacterium]